MNQCENCTLCCKLTAVPEYKKPVGKWCEFCDPRKGCLVYDTRPESCRNFKCVWLTGGLPPDIRPDKCKVIFERLPSGKTFLALVNSGYTDAWKEPNVRDVIVSLLKANKTVVVSTKPATFLVPPGRSKTEVIEELEQVKELYGIK